MIDFFMLSYFKKARNYLFELRLSKERKYILIVGGALLFVGLLYRGSPFFFDIFSGSEEIAVKTRKLIKYRQAVQVQNKLEETLRVLNQTLARAESSLLVGDTPALCAVDIQNILNEIANSTKIEIKTMLVLKPKQKKEMKYMSISVKFFISSTIEQLKGALYRIASSPKKMKVKDIEIRTGGRNKDQVEQIDSTITVVGFMKERDPSAPEHDEITRKAMEEPLKGNEKDNFQTGEMETGKTEKKKLKGRRGRGRGLLKVENKTE
ncbi:MAG: hypothetical protein KAI40_03610 [Desulfobacterales bacterium]|nr:hypothetical protein [Desulfobacterales bacterium]